MWKGVRVGWVVLNRQTFYSAASGQRLWTPEPTPPTGYPSAGLLAPPPSLPVDSLFVASFPPPPHPSIRLQAPAINITPRSEREGPVAGRRASRCSAVTNRWRTPGLALTAQLAANEPNASLALSVAAARLCIGALAFAASLQGDVTPRKEEVVLRWLKQDEGVEF